MKAKEYFRKNTKNRVSLYSLLGLFSDLRVLVNEGLFFESSRVYSIIICLEPENYDQINKNRVRLRIEYIDYLFSKAPT